jgi:alkanesulfonate monooxygenase SsuD/methylene tetrahydromethanopterin reductase-like flavin-dependent oxidoreductase (luciferase family)
MARFGVQISTAQCSMSELRDAWSKVEQLGFDWISGQDHFYSLRAPGTPSFEALATHTALAALTTRPRVGCLVYSAGYRHPAVMAKALTTIDHLSGGRLELGIGAGWLRAEYEDYGIAFEPIAARVRRLREAVEVIRLLWTQDTTDYHGEFYTLRHARSDPKPVQSPPRIWIGAGGLLALKVAADVGDGWNANFLSPEEFTERANQLREMMGGARQVVMGASTVLVVADAKTIDDVMRFRYGEKADQLRPSVLAGSLEQITEGVGRYVEAGAEWIILALRPPFEFEELEAFADEVVPHFPSDSNAGRHGRRVG